MSKVYISNLETPLGCHLVDLLRTDHLDPLNPTLIVGSAPGPMPYTHQTINFSTHPQVACRAVLDCDSLILDLLSDSHEAQVLMKFLEKCGNDLKKPLRVMGISTLMTWQGLRTFQMEKQSQKERMMGLILDQTSWKRIIWTDRDFAKRIPNNLYVRIHELENMLVGLNRIANIKATVVGTGLLYGRENLFMQSETIQGLSGESLEILGQGDNLIPLTHYDNLLDSIETLIKGENIPYAIVCDQAQYSQRQIKQILKDVTSNSAPFASKECYYLLKKETEWSINLTLQPSLPTSINRTFQTYARESLLMDFCDYNCYQPKQSFVCPQKIQEQSLKELTNLLKQHYILITQSDIQKVDQEIIIKMTPPEPQPSVKKQKKNSVLKTTAIQENTVVHYYRQAFEQLLQGRKYQNFVIICNQSLVSFVDKGLIYSTMVEIVPQNHVEDQQGQVIHFPSHEFYTHYQLSQPEPVFSKIDDNLNHLSNEKSEKYQPETQVRKDQQLVLLNQYLLDNVLLPISQAKFSLKMQKKDLNLRNFILQLKEIQARNNTRINSQLSQ